MNTPREWEKAFHKCFDINRYEMVPEDMDVNVESVKSFIRTLLDKAREEERERVRKLVEGMNQPEKRGHYGPYDHLHIQHNIGYNQALSDIIKALNEKEV